MCCHAVADADKGARIKTINTCQVLTMGLFSERDYRAATARGDGSELDGALAM